jgi:hypothetical protein
MDWKKQGDQSPSESAVSSTALMKTDSTAKITAAKT